LVGAVGTVQAEKQKHSLDWKCIAIEEYQFGFLPSSDGSGVVFNVLVERDGSSVNSLEVFGEFPFILTGDMQPVKKTDQFGNVIRACGVFDASGGVSLVLFSGWTIAEI